MKNAMLAQSSKVPFSEEEERDKKVDKLQTMSEKELQRVGVLQKLEEKRMRQSEAARLLALSVWQVKRLLKRYRTQGAAGLVSKRLGRPSNATGRTNACMKNSKG